MENTIDLPFINHYKSWRNITPNTSKTSVELCVFVQISLGLYQEKSMQLLLFSLLIIFFRGQGNNLSCSTAKLPDIPIWKLSCPLIISKLCSLTQPQTELPWLECQDSYNCKHLSIKISEAWNLKYICMTFWWLLKDNK